MYVMNRFLHSIRRQIRKNRFQWLRKNRVRLHFREKSLWRHVPENFFRGKSLWRHVPENRFREHFREECRTIHRNLHSQKGVTLAFSMVVFTVITIICLSLIQWSENAVRSSVSFTPMDEQAYLTVYSAAALFQDSIGENFLAVYSPPDGVSGENTFPAETSQRNNTFLNILRDMAREMQPGSPVERVLTVSVSSRSGETYPFNDIRAELTLYDDYQVEAVFSPLNADAPSISLNMNAQVTEETVVLVSADGETNVLLLKTTVTWPVEKREVSGKLS